MLVPAVLVMSLAMLLLAVIECDRMLVHQKPCCSLTMSVCSLSWAHTVLQWLSAICHNHSSHCCNGDLAASGIEHEEDAVAAWHGVVVPDCRQVSVGGLQGV